jgi:hypothetical protein
MNAIILKHHVPKFEMESWEMDINDIKHYYSNHWDDGNKTTLIAVDDQKGLVTSIHTLRDILLPMNEQVPAHTIKQFYQLLALQ